MVFANQLCGYQMIIMSPGMSDKFRRARKLLHRELGTKASSAQFGKMQEVEVGRQVGFPPFHLIFLQSDGDP